jgi:putative alpha-1,2-mannosidase
LLLLAIFDILLLVINATGKLRILVHGRQNATSDIYIQSLRINGAAHECAFVTHEVVTAGGTWEFYVGSSPNTAWGDRSNCPL